MTAYGGPPKTISINGREFRCIGDAAPNINLGGVTNEHMPNGDRKTARVIRTPITWGITGIAIEIDASNSDHEFLRDIQQGDDADVTITYSDDTSYAGFGNIQGELNVEPASASVSLDLKGPGELKKI